MSGGAEKDDDLPLMKFTFERNEVMSPSKTLSPNKADLAMLAFIQVLRSERDLFECYHIISPFNFNISLIQIFHFFAESAKITRTFTTEILLLVRYSHTLSTTIPSR